MASDPSSMSPDERLDLLIAEQARLESTAVGPVQMSAPHDPRSPRTRCSIAA